ncbi:hypothetical protein GS18_0207045 [Metabacillus indicus]|uniref:Uncharacterized protein n=1 Tax=Metabacillus indicus TaxID=246786 RepID=A0A084H187_METID|nr:hypothetical protein GS18_0207045 [Metabacillus indicus]
MYNTELHNEGIFTLFYHLEGVFWHFRDMKSTFRDISADSQFKGLYDKDIKKNAYEVKKNDKRSGGIKNI